MKTVRIRFCRTVIERDALLHFLSQKGIPAESEQRDVMINVSDTVNLTYGWASATFEGYGLWVPEDRADEAIAALKEWEHAQRLSLVGDEESAEEKNFRRFLVCAFFGMMLPVFMHLLAFYWLVRSGSMPRRRPVATIFGILVAGAGLAGWVVVGRSSFGSFLGFF